MFISYHSFGNMIIYPWNYDPNATALPHLKEMASTAADAMMKESGRKYKFGTVSEVLGSIYPHYKEGGMHFQKNIILILF